MSLEITGVCRKGIDIGITPDKVLSNLYTAAISYVWME